MISNVPSLQSPDPHNLYVNQLAGLFFGLSSAGLALVCVSHLCCTPPDPDGYTRHVREATTKSHPNKAFRYVQHETMVPTVVSSWVSVVADEGSGSGIARALSRNATSR